jgi:cytochrome b pre-mRNA-processing protein 3
MLLSLFKRFFNRSDGRAALQPLYQAVIAEARLPFWYADGKVPDTLDGRFDMVGAVLSYVLLRMEELGEPAQRPSVMLTEIFVDDMDGQLREEGIGDVIVGKHIGRMMAALGGRLTAYRAARAAGGDLQAALIRNVYRGAAPTEAGVVDLVANGLRRLDNDLSGCPLETLIAGRLRP